MTTPHLCGVVHPRHPDVTCDRQRPIAEHRMHSGGMRYHTKVVFLDWVNDAYVPSPPPPPLARTTQSTRLDRLAALVPGAPIERSPATLSAATDNWVQKAGATDGVPRSARRRRAALDALLAAGEKGLTYEELGTALHMEYSRVGPRVRELVRDGYVRDTGTTRTSSHGSQQSVWRAV